ncbi:nucleoside hydrolase [Desulforamulus putei]|uniref:Ribosylpyrimidine nucleosidase n=1 Tax=Desulforamulus putei DSM 12395 TaxID=1121429 RepID=A0A1M5CH01_9FIRM|nr:nucleoside hydrolase [Desulforamulus putei]SHF54044.1 ribosylpyrimidine nucleosidase [Desulforamulus putei DSM 12395]
MPRKIILDVDPGHDDAIAILLAANSPEIDLLGITTVAGNQILEKTTLNAQRICSAAGINAPIAKGMDRPIVRQQIIADDIHGNSGLDGPAFSKPTVDVIPQHAVNFIIETIIKSDGDITLVPTGPLTNIAMALLLEPKIRDKIQEIIFMGGAYGIGNTTPGAEFNIFADPEAAKIVLNSGLPLTMVGLDLTHQATATPDVIERIKSIGTPLANIVVELLEFFGQTYFEVFGFPAPPVHDPCTVAKLIDPDVFTTRHLYVDVDIKSELNYGRTVCDFYGVMGRQPNCHVAIDLNKERFWNLIIEAIKRY